MKSGLTLTFFIYMFFGLNGQTGIGLGLYPTGTEPGMGLRLSRDARLTADARIARTTLNSEKNKPSAMVSELALVCRLVRQERLRLHLGIGLRADWDFRALNRPGLVMPIGVEAFPFPFQNAGLFFEAAPFVSSDGNHYSAGLRTAGGFVFYFNKKSND